MSDTNRELMLKIRADISDLKSKLKQGEGSLDSFGKTAQTVGSSITQALTFVGVIASIGALIYKIRELSLEAAKTGMRTETLQIAMYQVGKNAGMSAGSLDVYVKQLKQAGITGQEAMLGLTKFMSTGLDVTKIAELATRARDIAVIADTNTSEAFNRLIQGIVSGETETLKRLGVNIGQLDQLMKKWAETLGVDKDQIGAVTRANMTLNEVLEKSARMAGTAAAADETVGKQLQSMTRFAEEAKNALWPLFQPAYLAYVQELTKGYKDLETWAKANSDKLREWGAAGAEWTKWIAQGIRDIGSFLAENKALIKILLELMVAAKVAGAFVGMGSSIKVAAVEAGILMAVLGKLSALMGGPWKIIITIALIGLYEAWNAIQKLRAEAGFTPKPLGMGEGLAGAVKEGRARDKAREGKELGAGKILDASEAERRGITQEKYLELQKEEQKRAVEGRYKKYTAPSLMPPPLTEHETAEERADREAKEFKAKAESEQFLGKGKDKKGGGGGADRIGDRLITEDMKRIEALRAAKIQEADDSLALLRTTNDRERAENAKKLEEGIIDGQTYYQRLREMQETETNGAIALIELKKQEQIKAHNEALAHLENKSLPEYKDMSEEARDLARQTLNAKHAKEMSKLSTDAVQAKLEGEIKVTEELRRQNEVQKKYKEKVEDLEVSAAWGPIEEQDARVRQMYLEWQRAKAEAIEAGAAPGVLGQMDKVYQKKVWGASPEAEQAAGFAQSLTSSFSSLVDALSSGTADLKSGLNSMFKGLFNQALKPGLKALEQLLMDGFKELFGKVGGAVGSAIMGVIGLVGMMLTSSSKSSFSPSGVESKVTSHEAVRGIIAGETSIPIAQISVSLSEALTPHLGVLRQIEANTRGGGAQQQSFVFTTPPQENRATQRESMDAYFREYLLQGAGK